MIKASTTVTDSNPDQIKDLKKLIHQLTKGYVSVGVHADAGEYEDGTEVVEVAFWNEFGTRTAPERSFFRSAIDENMSQINTWKDELLDQIMDGKLSVEAGLETLGFRVQTLIQNKIKSSVPPPNADSTAAQKRRDGVGDTTLIHTGLLLRSVTFKVVL